MTRIATVVVVSTLAVVVAGCSTKSAVVYPNAHLDRVGHVQYEADLAGCIAMADEHAAGASSSGEIAERATQGAIIGAAAGAASGAVRGNAGRNAGSRAAGRATSGLLSGVFGSDRPHPIVRRFVERCMRDKGYDIIGWG